MATERVHVSHGRALRLGLAKQVGGLGWRSDAEKAHVFAQFEEAREVYRERAREALAQ